MYTIFAVMNGDIYTGEQSPMFDYMVDKCNHMVDTGKAEECWIEDKNGAVVYKVERD
jgi:hypothetical protein